MTIVDEILEFLGIVFVAACIGIPIGIYLKKWQKK